MTDIKKMIKEKSLNELHELKYFYTDSSHDLEGCATFQSLFMNLEEIVEFLNSDKYDPYYCRVYQCVDANQLKDGVLLDNLKTMAGLK